MRPSCDHDDEWPAGRCFPLARICAKNFHLLPPSGLVRFYRRGGRLHSGPREAAMATAIRAPNLGPSSTSPVSLQHIFRKALYRGCDSCCFDVDRHRRLLRGTCKQSSCSPHGGLLLDRVKDVLQTPIQQSSGMLRLLISLMPGLTSPESVHQRAHITLSVNSNRAALKSGASLCHRDGSKSTRDGHHMILCRVRTYLACRKEDELPSSCYISTSSE